MYRSTSSTITTICSSILVFEDPTTATAVVGRWTVSFSPAPQSQPRPLPCLPSLWAPAPRAWPAAGTAGTPARRVCGSTHFRGSCRLMYAHGGRTVELKGELAIARRNDELAKAQKAADAKTQFAREVAQYSQLRRSIYRLQKTPAWGNVFIVAILLYALMLAFYDPLQPDDVGGNAFISAADPVFTVIFTVDMAGGLIADGVRRFLSDPWNVMDVVIVGAGWLDFVPGVDAGALQ
eukprot:48459_3